MKFTAPHRRAAVAASLALVAALSLAACTTDGTDPEGPDGPAVEPSLVFAGPNGEVPGLLDELQLTDDEIAEIQAGEYTAAFVWHGSGDFVSAVERGARAEFEELGIEVVATTEAAFDPAAQANNVQSVMALDPDIVVAIAADPTSAAASFQPILDAGAKLDHHDQGTSAGRLHGRQRVRQHRDREPHRGGPRQRPAPRRGTRRSGQGGLPLLRRRLLASTQQRDQAFKDWLAYLYPDIELVAEEGFADPAKTQDIAASVVARHPDLNGIYVSRATGPRRGRARRSA